MVFPRTLGKSPEGSLIDAAGWHGRVRPQLLGLPILSSELRKDRRGSFHGERTGLGKVGAHA